ncbi:hypothetical protein KDL45_01710 [bacterium]|nr:hypothetical protein [bacterium]
MRYEIPVVGFGREGVADMGLFAAIFLGLMGLFAVAHLAAGFVRKKGADAHYDRGDPTYYAMIASLGLLVAAIVAEAVAMGAVPSTPTMWVGRAMVVGSLFWTLWCRKVIGDNYVSTARNTDPSQTLVTHGPYRFMKHPIYMANIATAVGLALAFSVRWSWGAVAVFVAVVIWRIRLEEAHLREKFGEAYP